eukprot:1174082-Prorocentrum_minimum.AAC.2
MIGFHSHLEVGRLLRELAVRLLGPLGGPGGLEGLLVVLAANAGHRAVAVARRPRALPRLQRPQAHRAEGRLEHQNLQHAHTHTHTHTHAHTQDFEEGKVNNNQNDSHTHTHTHTEEFEEGKEPIHSTLQPPPVKAPKRPPTHVLTYSLTHSVTHNTTRLGAPRPVKVTIGPPPHLPPGGLHGLRDAADHRPGAPPCSWHAALREHVGNGRQQLLQLLPHTVQGNKQPAAAGGVRLRGLAHLRGGVGDAEG